MEPSQGLTETGGVICEDDVCLQAAEEASNVLPHGICPNEEAPAQHVEMLSSRWIRAGLSQSQNATLTPILALTPTLTLTRTLPRTLTLNLTLDLTLP